MPKLALFHGSSRSITSLLISYTTQCTYTHAAIEIDGQWWHSSEKLGCFGKLDPANFNHRQCTVYEFEGDLSDWLKNMQGKRYGWRGIVGWTLYAMGIRRGVIKGHAQHYYCFMAALKALLTAYKNDSLKVLRHGAWGLYRRPVLIAENNKKAKVIRGKLRHFNVAILQNQLPPISGCDLADVFPSGQSGTFKNLSGVKQ